MVRNLDLTTPSGILFGWLAAIFGFASAVLMAVGGQGFGALVGGCGWIGISTPLGRQVWALVNQPAVNFASEGRAVGYWLGSLAIPLLAGIVVLHLIPRPRTLAAELIAVHLAWGATAVGVAWLPLLEPDDGHLARFLDLFDLPSLAVWTAPAIAACAAFAPVLRLLALVRVARPHAGRGTRLAAVAAHLGTPCVAWAALVSILRGAPPVAPIVALLAPLLISFTVAWLGYPPAYIHRLKEIGPANWLRLAASAVVVVTLVWLAGRPLGNDTWAGLLWGDPSSRNNIRPWVVATHVWSPWTTSN